MVRSATRPRYYPSRKGYFVRSKGKQHALAMGLICLDCQRRDKRDELPKCEGCRKIWDAASLRFAELMHCAAVDTAEDNSLIFAVCNRYLKWVKEHRKQRTYERTEFFLKLFSEEVGHLKVKDLKPFHVEDWLAKMSTKKTVDTPKGSRSRGWGKSSRRMALEVVLACLNYAVKKGFITKNPLTGKVDRPGVVSRSKDALIPPDVFQAMLTEQEKKYEPRYYPSHKGYFVLYKNKPILLAKGPEGDEDTLTAARAKLEELRLMEPIYEEFALLLRFLHHTGARPGEIYNATATDWNPDIDGEGTGAFIYPAGEEPEKEAGFTHQTARKKKERVVYISDPELVRIVNLLCRKYPEGPILRGITGQPWTDHAVWWRLDQLKEKLKLNPKITPYSFRHTSITDMVIAGQPLSLVAEVHGTSVPMIERPYSHPDEHRKAMATWRAQARTTRPSAEALAAALAAEAAADQGEEDERQEDVKPRLRLVEA
ncbi:MAG: site-specific integrase [Gemmataceae bacterium]|nr:site-specific integrase [Gemmataceae bacterium]